MPAKLGGEESALSVGELGQAWANADVSVRA